MSYGLDTHIPSRTNASMIYTELEVFYQGLLKGICNVPKPELQLIRTTLRNSCEKYTKIKAPYKYRKIINKLRKQKCIAVLKVHKGKNFVIINREKCLELTDMEQFQKLSHDPTKRGRYKMFCVRLSQNFQLTSTNEYIRLVAP